MRREIFGGGSDGPQEDPRIVKALELIDDYMDTIDFDTNMAQIQAIRDALTEPLIFGKIRTT